MTDPIPAAAPAYGGLPAPLVASARLSTALAVLCAGASLAGWILGIDALTRVVPGWPVVRPATAIGIIVTAAAFALLTSESPRRRAAAVLLLTAAALAVLASMVLPAAERLPGGALPAYAGSVLLLIMVGAAFVTAPGSTLLAAGRLVAVAAAALLFVALIGISFRLLLGREPLVDVSLPSLIALLLLSYAVAVVRPDHWLLERLTAQRPGAVIARRLLPAAVLLPLIVGWIEVAGEGAGILDSAFGAVLQTVLTMFGLAALVLWGVRRLDLTEAQREGAEQALRDAYGELDMRVQERTAALERANAALHDSVALLRGVAESTPDLMVVKDTQGRVIMANPAYVEAIGRSETEIVGRTDSEFLADPVLAQRIVESDRSLMSSGRVERVEEVIQTPQGVRTYLATKSPLRDVRGNVTGVIAVSTDITERKSAELERERLMSVEQRLRQEAERANRAKDEFLAIVSHELRSPLNALRGWGFLLGSAKVPDADLIERATQAIKRNVDHQARLIDDLLDTSRIMSGKLNIERRPVNLVEVIQGAVEVVKQAAAAKRITIELKAERPAIALEGDAARLHQIAVNLLSNAVKFTPEAGNVTALVEIRAGEACLAVTDTGSGIEPEFLPRVFDRFTQADTTTTRRHGGLGIGLALVRHLTELHGGNVSASSAGAGKGSTFTVCLPLPQAARPEDTDRALAPADAAVSGLAGVSIYALDDDPDARDVISLTLTHAGADVRTMSSGAELIAALDRELPQKRPDVLLMDLAMPDEDGFSVLARVRALERSKATTAAASLPAIAVTAFTEVTRERAIEQGFTDHVSKPIDPARLVATIRRTLRAPVTAPAST
jgi:PAS domain S-box-containing protein